MAAALAHLAQRRAQERFAHAAAAVLGRNRDRAHARHRQHLPAHPGAQRIEHERRHHLAFQLRDAHVAQREARVVGVELAALLDARDAVGARTQVGQRLDVGAARGTVADHRRTRGARGAHRRGFPGGMGSKLAKPGALGKWDSGGSGRGARDGRPPERAGARGLPQAIARRGRARLDSGSLGSRWAARPKARGAAMFARTMHRPRTVLALVMAMALIAPRAVHGWDCGACPVVFSDPSSVLYQLSDKSRFDIGCLAPCECPLLTRSGLTGSFVLIPYQSGPLFAEYLLCGIDWHVPAAGVSRPDHITGEGWYRVGGEVAAQQELRLCVSVNGGPIQRFESGLVPGGGDFPAIDIAAATSGFFCYDSVLAVRAGPAPAGAPDERTGAFAIHARPNPASGPVDFEILLPHAAAVSLRILDVEGRTIRTLEHGTW